MDITSISHCQLPSLFRTAPNIHHEAIWLFSRGIEAFQKIDDTGVTERPHSHVADLWWGAGLCSQSLVDPLLAREGIHRRGGSALFKIVGQ